MNETLNAPGLFSGLFAAALLLSVGLRMWLSWRQMRHVTQHRPQVPDAFADSVSLASHQKAADYTLAKSSFGLVTLLFNTAVLVGWTLLGGLSALNQAINQDKVSGNRYNAQASSEVDTENFQ